PPRCVLLPALRLPCTPRRRRRAPHAAAPFFGGSGRPHSIDPASAVPHSSPAALHLHRHLRPSPDLKESRCQVLKVATIHFGMKRKRTIPVLTTS
ncbi:hypothetical protein EJB05_27844, partial [Eragrostis curvula]